MGHGNNFVHGENLYQLHVIDFGETRGPYSKNSYIPAFPSDCTVLANLVARTPCIFWALNVPGQ